jgi:integrase
LLAHIAANKEPIPDHDETKRELNSGQALNQQLTVGEWLDLWTETEHHRRGTERSYEAHVRLYLKPNIGSIRIDRLHVGHVTKLLQAIEDEEAGLTARQIADILGHARPSMTQDVYMGRQAASRDGADALHAVLGTNPK